MLELVTYLTGLKAIGPIVQAVPEVAEIVSSAINLIHTKDQDTAKEALTDLIAENDEGYKRLDEKLRIASGE